MLQSHLFLTSNKALHQYIATLLVNQRFALLYDATQCHTESISHSAANTLKSRDTLNLD